MPQVDWQKVTSANDFASFCAKILKSEISRHVHICDRPGQDYKIDGSWEGEYAGEDGSWVFQFKAYADFDVLKAKMKQEVDGILDTRDDGGTGEGLWAGVTHYRLLTTVRCSPQNLQELRDILTPLGLDSDVWFREDIECMAVRHPFVLHYFFGADRPLLYPFDEALAHCSANPVVGPYYRADRMPYVEPPQVASEFQEFLSCDAQIMVLTGAPGVGKSRAMLELARGRADEADWSPRFVFPCESQMDAHMDELPLSGTYVVFADEAERCVCLPDLHRTLSRDSRYQGRFKLVIASSPVAVESVMHSLADPHSTAQARRRRLEPSRDITQNMLQHSGLDGDAIRRIQGMAEGLPIWAVLAIDSATARTEGDAPDSQSELARHYVREFSRQIADQGIEDHLVETALLAIAAVQPMDLDTPEFLAGVAQLSAVPQHRASRAVQAVAASGLVTKHGRLSGIVPDVLAIEVLATNLYGHVGSPVGLHNELISVMLPVNPVSLLRNLAMVEGRTGSTLLDELMEETRGELPGLENPRRLAVLLNLKETVTYRPMDYLELCELVFRSPAPTSSTEISFFGLPYVQDVTHEDVVGAGVENLSSVRYSLDAVPRLVTLLLDITAEHSLHRKTADDAARLLSQVGGHDRGKPVQYYHAFLSAIEAWLADAGGNAERLARVASTLTSALRTTLTPEFTDTRSGPEPMSVSFGQMTLRPVPAMITIWTRATDMLANMVRSREPHVSPEAARALAEALRAVDRVQQTDTGNEDSAAWAEEKDRRLGILAELAEEDVPLAALNAIEGGVSWDVEYGTEFESEAASGVVRRLEEHDDYLLYRMLAGEHCPGRAYSDPNEATDLLLGRTAEEAASALARVLSVRPGWIFGKVKGTLVLLAQRDPSYAVELYGKLRSGSIDAQLLLPYWGDLLAPLRTTEPEFIMNELHMLVDSKDAHDWQTAASVYEVAVHRDLRVPITDDDVSIIAALSGKQHEDTDIALLGSLPLFHATRPDFFSQQLAAMAERITPATATAVLEAACLGESYRTDLSQLPWLLDTLQTFISLPDLDRLGHAAHEVQHLLEQIAAVLPLWVVEFFEARLDEAERRDPGEYDAVPFGIHRILADVPPEHHDFREVVSRIRDWVLRPPARPIDAPKAFSVLAHIGGLSGVPGEALREWIDSGDTDTLWHAAILLRDLPLTDELSDLVAEAVEAAQPVGADGRKKIENELACAMTTHGVVSSQFGEPSPHCVALIEVFSRLRDRNTTGAVVAFCDRVIQNAEQHIEAEQERDEELLNW